MRLLRCVGWLLCVCLPPPSIPPFHSYHLPYYRRKKKKNKLTQKRAHNICPSTTWPLTYNNNNNNPTHWSRADANTNTWLSNLPSTWTWSSCSSTLQSVDCHKDLGFPNPPGKPSFYKPDDLPSSSATASLSNTGGPVSEPPSGTVFTWSQARTTYTVEASAVGDGATGIGTETGTGTAVGSVQSGVASRVEGRVLGVVLGLGLGWVVWL